METSFMVGWRAGLQSRATFVRAGHVQLIDSGRLLWGLQSRAALKIESKKWLGVRIPLPWITAKKHKNNYRYRTDLELN